MPRLIADVSSSIQLDRVSITSISPLSCAGFSLPPALSAALTAALDAGYLPCLERTLRCGLRSFPAVAEFALVFDRFFSTDMDGRFTGPCASSDAWFLMLPYGKEREAAAWLATTAKMVRRVLVTANSSRLQDVVAGILVTQWLCQSVQSFLWEAADGAMEGLGQQQPAGGQGVASPSNVSPVASCVGDHESTGDRCAASSSSSSSSSSTGSGGASSSGAPSPTEDQ